MKQREYVQIIEQIKSGKRYKDIADEFGFSHKYISKIAINNGIRRGAGNRNKLSPEQVERMKIYRSHGVTYKNLAEVFGIDKRTVFHYLNEV